MDAEGFPRADLDLYSVKEKRHRLACLQTDHKALMKQVEEIQLQLFSSVRAIVGFLCPLPCPCASAYALSLLCPLPSASAYALSLCLCLCRCHCLLY